MWSVCNKGITRFYLPHTHVPGRPAFTPQPQRVTVLWLVLIALAPPTHEDTTRQTCLYSPAATRPRPLAGTQRLRLLPKKRRPGWVDLMGKSLIKSQCQNTNVCPNKVILFQISNKSQITSPDEMRLAIQTRWVQSWPHWTVDGVTHTMTVSCWWCLQAANNQLLRDLIRRLRRLVCRLQIDGSQFVCRTGPEGWTSSV